MSIIRLLLGLILGYGGFHLWLSVRHPSIRRRVLAFLSSDPEFGSRRGRDIIYGARISRGFAYVHLSRMETDGFIASFKEDETLAGLARRRYFLTTKGRRCLP